MKKWTMILVYMAYIVAVLAIVEAIREGVYINGIISSLVMVWLGNKLKAETDNL